MGNTKGTLGPKIVLTKQQQIAELAKRLPDKALTTLNHYLDMDWMREAYRRVRKDSAPGYDDVTVEEYGKNLEDNLMSLLNRAKSGKYKAPPVRRTYIPKGTSKTEMRPIGIPTTENKVLERAVVMILEPIYENEFSDFSYGFRPKRSAHQALENIWQQIMDNRISWVLEVDIRKFFDTMKHEYVREFFRQRVRDGVLTRLIDKWLKAGILEEGIIEYPEKGSPQGGVVSPMISNVYLHEVMDKWYVNDVKPRMRGKTFTARFADDLVMGFECKEDAEKVYKAIGKRFERFGLTLHPEKTRLVYFKKPNDKDGNKPDTFDFLGFTHYWGKSKRGYWVMKRKTASKKFNQGLKRIMQWCSRNRHNKMTMQHKKLCEKLRGHFSYYGITGNGKCLQKFREEVMKIWRKWLCRRSRKPDMSWERFGELTHNRYRMPPARVVHSIYS